jgi:hypothetical protein
VVGVFLTFASKVKVAHRGFEEAMTHILLDVADIDTGFKQVGCVTVAQRVDADALVIDAELF